MSVYADNIRRIAKEKGIKLEDIYTSIGMSNAGFYKMLKNGRYKDGVLEKIATLLGVEEIDLGSQTIHNYPGVSGTAHTYRVLMNYTLDNIKDAISDAIVYNPNISSAELFKKLKEEIELHKKTFNNFDVIQHYNPELKPNQ